MKTLGFGAATFGAAVLLLSLAPAHADTNVLCVQQALAARGYDPGPLDGELGARTQAAAQAAGIAPLTVGNAGAWCQTLRSPAGTFSLVVPVPGTAALARTDSSSALFRRTFNSPVPQLCPSYVIDADDPCF